MPYFCKSQNGQLTILFENQESLASMAGSLTRLAEKYQDHEGGILTVLSVDAMPSELDGATVVGTNAAD